VIRRGCGVSAVWAGAVLAVLVATSPAMAQTPAPSTPAKSPATAKRLEFDVGGMFLTPVGMGTQDMSITAANGQPVPFAKTSSRTGPSFGLEARMGFPITPRFAVEVAGSWSSVDFETEVSGDTEIPTGLTVSLGVSRLTAGGSATWRLRQKARNEIYAIGGASWLRDISELSASGVYDDGAIVDGGAGMKMLFKDAAQGKIKRVGLRFEGRVGVRIGGLTLDDKNTHISTAFLASLLIGS